jgi:hypothetical protein
MPRLFTRRQQAENDAFLEALRRTGNARLAAREIGVHRSTYLKRRARSAAFATDWDGALAAAHAAFHLSGGARPPEACPERSRRGGARPPETSAPAKPARVPARLHPLRTQTPQPPRTQGGEPTIVRTASGRLQLRRAAPARMTAAAEQAFLAALSATANVRLAAAAAGFAHSSFYARRSACPAFAREMRIALEIGYSRLEASLLARAHPASHSHAAWRHAELPPLRPVTFDEGFQLLCLHDKSVRHGWEQAHRRKRRTESDEAYVERLRAMWHVEEQRAREHEALLRATRYERTGGWRHPHEPAPPPPLPPLDLVTGWSKPPASPPTAPASPCSAAGASKTGAPARPPPEPGTLYKVSPSHGPVYQLPPSAPDRGDDPHQVNAGAYNKVVERAVLRSIRLTEAGFDMKPEELELDPSIWRKDIRGEVEEVFADAESDRLAGTFVFEVVFRYKRKRVLIVSARYLVMYQVSRDYDIDVGELFVERVGRVVTYPYFRSVVATLAAQAGVHIPPLPIISLAPRRVSSVADLEEQGPVKLLSEGRRKQGTKRSKE